MILIIMSNVITMLSRCGSSESLTRDYAIKECDTPRHYTHTHMRTLIHSRTPDVYCIHTSDM